MLTSSRSPQRFRLRARLLSLGLILVVLVVGLATAYGCGGGGGSNSDAVTAMEKFLLVGQDPGTTNKVLLNELPPGLPAGLPDDYPGSKLIGSTVMTGSTANNGLGVLRESGDPVDKVYAYYEQALVDASWQIQMSTFPGKVAGVQFASTSDASITGAYVIQPSSDNGGGSMIFLSIQTAPASNTSEPFKLEPSKPLPRNWPTQMPVFSNAVITDTGWGQTTSSVEWQITFLAQAVPKDIIDYYRTTLPKIGFTVTDEPPQGQTSLLSFDAPIDASTSVKGALSAQVFAQDSTYAQATLQLAIASASTSAPSGTPTP